MERDLVAGPGLNKYGTRRLLPGDHFHAPERWARILVALGKAHYGRPPVDVPPPPASVTQKIAAREADMAALRSEYERVVGRRPFMGWGADALRQKIADAS